MLRVLSTLALLLVSNASAHYTVIGVEANGKLYNGWWPCYWGPQADYSKDVIRPMDCLNPVTTVDSPALACSYSMDDHKFIAAKQTAPIAAGSDVKFYWTDIHHPGPMLYYMARCPQDNCKNWFPGKNDKTWFKISQAGYYDGKWASEHAHANNDTWTVTVPADLYPGNYLIRAEQIGLHWSHIHKAQFFVSCTEAKITGNGKSEPSQKVAFPGAYGYNDPGIYILKFWYDFNPAKYIFPGPPVYTAKSNSTKPIKTVKVPKKAKTVKIPKKIKTPNLAYKDGRASK